MFIEFPLEFHYKIYHRLKHTKSGTVKFKFYCKYLIMGINRSINSHFVENDLEWDLAIVVKLLLLHYCRANLLLIHTLCLVQGNLELKQHIIAIISKSH